MVFITIKTNTKGKTCNFELLSIWKPRREENYTNSYDATSSKQYLQDYELHLNEHIKNLHTYIISYSKWTQTGCIIQAATFEGFAMQIMDVQIKFWTFTMIASLASSWTQYTNFSSRPAKGSLDIYLFCKRYLSF